MRGRESCSSLDFDFFPRFVSLVIGDSKDESPVTKPAPVIQPRIQVSLEIQESLFVLRNRELQNVDIKRFNFECNSLCL